MTESITFRKSNNREKIITFLRENPMRYEDLRTQARKWEENDEMRYQTFRRWFLKLRASGTIIEPPIRIAEEYSEANRFEVAALIQGNFREGSSVLLQGRLYQLLGISKTHKIAHIPRVMHALNLGIQNPIITRNDDVFTIILEIIKNIVESEKKHPIETSRKILKEISTDFIPIINEITKEKPVFPSGSLLHLLSLMGNRDSQDIIFSKMSFYAKLETGERTTINLGYFLGPTSEIYMKYFREINRHLDELAQSENERIQDISLELRKQMAQANQFIIRARDIGDNKTPSAYNI